MTLPAPDAFPVTVAPTTTHRVVPSRFPPVSAFEAVATAEDLEAVMELEGWTNDRLVAHRLRRLDPADWVFGRLNASVVMAAFLHGGVGGARFASPDLGAWYAAGSETTALVEVLSGVRREVAASALGEATGEWREYTARLTGTFVDIRGAAPDLHDPTSHAAGQAFGEAVRASPLAGIAYDSVRDAGGDCFVGYRPRRILDVVQARHWRARVPLRGKIFVERLDAG